MIYLDNAATTKPLDSVLEYAKVYLEKFYNPSALYSAGLDVNAFLQAAREFITAKICPAGYTCIFTSGGTESDNTAIFSYARRGNAVTTAGEHSAVYEAFKHLPQGVEARLASLNKDGSVNIPDLLSKIDSKTGFVSVVHVNNETGAINDINYISAEVKRINPKAIFHSDGVQAFGKLPFKLAKTVDLYSVSAHKIGALKGTGALFKRTDLHLHPLIYGGGQEGDLRSGTENVFGIAAMYKATEEKFLQIKVNYERAAALKQRLINGLSSDITVLSGEASSPYVVSLSAEGLKGEVLQHMLEAEGIIVGTGSACSSRNHYSRILKECSYSNAVLEGVIRLSTSPETTVEEIDFAIEKINSSVEKLKKVIR